MEPFNHAIALRVVGTCSGTFRAQKFGEAVPELGFELSAPIGYDVGGDTETGYPSTDEGFCN